MTSEAQKPNDPRKVPRSPALLRGAPPRLSSLVKLPTASNSSPLLLVAQTPAVVPPAAPQRWLQWYCPAEVNTAMNASCAPIFACACPPNSSVDCFRSDQRARFGRPFQPSASSNLQLESGCCPKRGYFPRTWPKIRAFPPRFEHHRGDQHAHRTASILNESGRIFRCVIGESPGRWALVRGQVTGSLQPSRA